LRVSGGDHSTAAAGQDNNDNNGNDNTTTNYDNAELDPTLFPLGVRLTTV